MALVDIDGLVPTHRFNQGVCLIRRGGQEEGFVQKLYFNSQELQKQWTEGSCAREGGYFMTVRGSRSRPTDIKQRKLGLTNK